MKNAIRLIGIIVLAAVIVFSFAACPAPGAGIGGAGGGSTGGGGARTGSLSTARYIWTDGVNDYDLHITGNGGVSRAAALSGNYTLTITDKNTGEVKVVVGVASGSDTSLTLSNEGGSLVEIAISGDTITIKYDTIVITTAGTGNVTISAGNYDVIITDGSPYDGNNGYDAVFYSIPEFKAWLDAKPYNTAASPYTVKLNISDLGGNYYTSGSVGNALYTNRGNKYVSLDLSGSTFTSIGVRAFYVCTSLTSVTIPNSVTNIGDYAFEYCDSLTAINVDANNFYYSTIDGVLYNKNKTTLVAYPAGKKGSFTIPNSVTSIGEGAFSCSINLTGITIPNSVTNIGDCAFESCESLTGITIPNSVTSIGQRAFSFCLNLTSVTIGNSVTSIGKGAFGSCHNLTSVTIPSSVTSIWDSAFGSCTSLTSVTFAGTIPSSGFYDSSFYDIGGDLLRAKFYATNTTNGTPGTYKRTGMDTYGYGGTWTKQ